MASEKVKTFTDGIPPSYVSDDPKIADRFVDGDAAGTIGPACVPEHPPLPAAAPIVQRVDEALWPAAAP